MSDVLAEFHYTMWQSGPRHDPELDENGVPYNWYEHKEMNFFGRDSYFTNGEYQSGWTCSGRSICGPLFSTKLYKDGYYRIYNNRFIAYHIGMSGKLFRYSPYRLMMTYSRNCGKYGEPLVPGAYVSDTEWVWWKQNTWDKPLPQFSAALNGYVPFYMARRGRLDIVYGLYLDAGELLNKCFGCTLGVRFTL